MRGQKRSHRTTNRRVARVEIPYLAVETLVSCVRNPRTKSFDLPENQVHICGPHERLRVFVAVGQVVEHGRLQVLHHSVTSALHGAIVTSANKRSTRFPATTGWREMDAIARRRAS